MSEATEFPFFLPMHRDFGQCLNQWKFLIVSPGGGTTDAVEGSNGHRKAAEVAQHLLE